MRVALFSDTYPPQINGVATATATLAEALRKHGDEVLVVTVSKEGQRRITCDKDVVRIPGITFKRLYSYKFATFYSRKAEKAVMAFKPDVIHVQTEIGIGIFGRILAHKYSLPLLYTYHTMYEDYTYYVTKGIKLFDSYAKRVVAFVSAIIGDSTTEFITTSVKTEKALKDYGVKKYINVIPNGLDFSPFDSKNIDSKRVGELKDKYGLNGKKVLLILGRMAKEKANDLIIKYYADYMLEHPQSDLVILAVGDGPDKESLEALAKEKGVGDKVIFTGPVDHKEVPLYYALADIYTSASVSETQGLTYIEAMASGKIVMARYDLNLTDVISDGRTGFFFKDEASFSEKLTHILSLPQEEKNKIIKSAYDNDVSKYGLDLYYERIHLVYEKAIRKLW